MPHVTMVLASTANYMICDDHEFTDDLGRRPTSEAEIRAFGAEI